MSPSPHVQHSPLLRHPSPRSPSLACAPQTPSISSSSSTHGDAPSPLSPPFHSAPLPTPTSPPIDRNISFPSLSKLQDNVAQESTMVAGGKAQPSSTPSLCAILDAFRKDGEGDREMLLAILAAKKAEEERQAALDTLRSSYLALHTETLRQTRLSREDHPSTTSPFTRSPSSRSPRSSNASFHPYPTAERLDSALRRSTPPSRLTGLLDRDPVGAPFSPGDQSVQPEHAVPRKESELERREREIAAFQAAHAARCGPSLYAHHPAYAYSSVQVRAPSYNLVTPSVADPYGDGLIGSKRKRANSPCAPTEPHHYSIRTKSLRMSPSSGAQATGQAPSASPRSPAMIPLPSTATEYSGSQVSSVRDESAPRSFGSYPAPGTTVRASTRGHGRGEGEGKRSVVMERLREKVGRRADVATTGSM